MLSLARGRIEHLSQRLPPAATHQEAVERAGLGNSRQRPRQYRRISGKPQPPPQDRVGSRPLQGGEPACTPRAEVLYECERGGGEYGDSDVSHMGSTPVLNMCPRLPTTAGSSCWELHANSMYTCRYRGKHHTQESQNRFDRGEMGRDVLFELCASKGA